jgi:OOP family OmpA-OmpF porin
MRGIDQPMLILKKALIMIKKIAIAASLAVLASSAFAAPGTPGVYAGVDVGSSKVSGIDDRETSAGAFVGYNFNQNFALEAGYRRLFDADEYSVDQAALSVIGTIPLNNGFSVYGRLGYNRLNLEVQDEGKAHESKALYGFGVGYAFTPTISGRVEVQKPHSDVTNVSAGVAFQF